MPETSSAKGLEFLTRKVGPLPLWVWLAAGLGLVYYYQRKNAAPAAAGTVVDPAGNVCSALNPLTGFCPGSAADIAATGGAVQGGTTTDTSGPGPQGDTGGGATDTSGGAGSGAPAGGPAPTPAPVHAPPVNPKWSYPAPSGLTRSAVSDSGYSISWKPVTGPGGQHPTGYTVATYSSRGALVDEFVSGSTSTKEYGRGGKGLTPGATYHTNVWANGGPQAPPHSTVTVTLKAKGKK